ncbi:MAG: hypothetical protein ACE5G0_04025 [Rhodothermales bacterium]
MLMKKMRNLGSLASNMRFLNFILLVPLLGLSGVEHKTIPSTRAAPEMVLGHQLKCTGDPPGPRAEWVCECESSNGLGTRQVVVQVFSPGGAKEQWTNDNYILWFYKVTTTDPWGLGSFNAGENSGPGDDDIYPSFDDEHDYPELQFGESSFNCDWKPRQLE